DLGIPLPDAHLVRTTGKEEGGAAYPRGNLIALSMHVLNDPKQNLVELISHELFHIISRHDPALRNQLYKAIGFEECAEYSFPAKLASRRITEPDAPRNDHCIHLRYRGESVWATPVLFADRARYDLKKG